MPRVDVVDKLEVWVRPVLWVAVSQLQPQHRGVTFKWKDYRAKRRHRYKTMTLATPEFIRRFLIHVLPTGFHRIRHYGLFANHTRVKYVQRLRQLLSEDAVDTTPATDGVDDQPVTSTTPARPAVHP